MGGDSSRGVGDGGAGDNDSDMGLMWNDLPG